MWRQRAVFAVSRSTQEISRWLVFRLIDVYKPIICVAVGVGLDFYFVMPVTIIGIFLASLFSIPIYVGDKVHLIKYFQESSIVSSMRRTIAEAFGSVRRVQRPRLINLPGGAVELISRNALLMMFAVITFTVAAHNIPVIKILAGENRPRDFGSEALDEFYAWLSWQSSISYLVIAVIGLVSVSPPFWIAISRIWRGVTGRKRFLRIVAWVVGFGIVTSGVVLLGKEGWALVSDYFVLRERTRRFSPAKIDIAELFWCFKTEVFRDKYVNWLEMNSIEFHRELGEESNVWPNGRRPQIPNDAPSVRLARLDAKWCGLE